MFSDKLTTTDARQVTITRVAKGSPADGILAVGDVILGVAGTPFSYDPRTELGKALTTAESEAGAGNLSPIRWRDGKQDNVVVKLPVLDT
jgi:S1-C subfamily serine protease